MLNDLSFLELSHKLTQDGLPKYRAAQIYKWFARGILDFAEMTDLSKDLRDSLAEKYPLNSLEIAKKLTSEIDGTIKYLLRLRDGSLIESVFMRYHHGNTVCLSSQVGCRMNCAFCASTKTGRARNLTPGEMLGQVALAQRDTGETVKNVVIMGIGEPLDNFDNVVTFLRNINDENGMNIGFRHISLSTCGLVDRIHDLADLNLPITLSISLHAPDDATRSRIMPINKRHNIADLMNACRRYLEATHRRISFEYILIDGLNDSVDHARKLAKLLRGMLCHVNLIPANAVPDGKYSQSSKARMEDFLSELSNNKINATIRRELGADISAACGQLRAESQN